MDPRRQRAAWAAGTALAVLLAFAPAVAGRRTLSHGDTDRLYAPIRTLVVAALRDARLPLWNPYEGTGKPLFAEGIHSVLHPVSLLGAALAPASVDLLILAHLVLAALGAFALATALGTSGAAAAGAGAAFALSGFSASMTGNLVFLAGLSSLPWVLATARAAGGGARAGTLATALATACAFLSGDAQSAAVGAALGTVLAAEAGGARGAARALAGVAAGVLLAGVQLATTAALVPLSTRAGGLEPWETTLWALAPARTLEWVVPGLLRGPAAEAPAGASGAWLPTPFADSVYLGAPLLVAAVLGLAPGAPGRRRTGTALALAWTALLWLALGHHLGARQLLEWVPVWSRFRYSEKLMAPLALCTCALAARGVDAFAAATLSPRWRGAIAAGAIAALAALAVLVVAPEATAGIAARLLGDAGPFHRATLAAGLPHLALALGAVLAVDRLRGARARAPALTLVLAGTAAAALPFAVPLGSLAARRAGAPLDLRGGEPVPRLVHPAEAAFDDTERRRFSDAAVRSGTALLLPSLNVARRVDVVEPYGGLAPARLLHLAEAFGAGWARSFRRFGVTHVVLPIPAEEASRPLAAAAIEGGALVSRRDGAPAVEVWAVPHRPWAFFATRTLPAATQDDALREVLTLADAGDDGAVVVEAPAPLPAAPGRVLSVERATESVGVVAESDGPGLLVVQDAFWPGWRATVDGRPAEILAADALVRAVRWPAGRHRLEMTYEPPELRTGLAVSAAGAALLLLALAGARRGPTA